MEIQIGLIIVVFMAGILIGKIWYSDTSIKGIFNAHGQFSNITFGIRSPEGPLKHLAKEVQEAIEAPDDFEEYADMQLLLWDAFRLAGGAPDQLITECKRKLKINKKRKWGPINKDGFAEHIKEKTK